MEISVTGYIYSKDSELFSDCADRYAINTVNHKFSISDGVTKSFFPNYWAEILVNEFVNTVESEFNEHDLISRAQEKWREKVSEIVKKPEIKWFTRNAYNKGTAGLATFVGLQLIPEESKWRATALGDSFLFFVPDTMTEFDKDLVLLSSKPKLTPFDNFPDYYKSIGSTHKGNKSDYNGIIRSGTFYLMTDALAEWFLNEKQNAIGKIQVWSSQSDFEKFVDEERLSKKLGNDDSAILIIEVNQVNESNRISYNHIDISDIGKLIQNEQKVKASKENTSNESEITSSKVSEVQDGKRIDEQVNEVKEKSLSDEVEASSSKESVVEDEKSITEQSGDKAEEITSDELESTSSKVSEIHDEKRINEQVNEVKEKSLSDEVEASSSKESVVEDEKSITEQSGDKAEKITSDKSENTSSKVSEVQGEKRINEQVNEVKEKSLSDEVEASSSKESVVEDEKSITEQSGDKAKKITSDELVNTLNQKTELQEEKSNNENWGKKIFKDFKSLATNMIISKKSETKEEANKKEEEKEGEESTNHDINSNIETDSISDKKENNPIKKITDKF